MKIKQQLFTAIATLTLLISLLISCNQDADTPVKVGINSWPGFEPLFLARDLGYYQNTSIELIDFPSSSEVIQAYRNKNIEVAALTIDETLLLAQSHPQVRIVLETDTSNGADVILGQPEIDKLQALKGKKIGVESGALGAFLLTRALEKVALSPKDVKIVPLDSSIQEQAFKDKTVDAVVTFEPTRSKLLATGANILFDSTQIPGEIVDVIVTSENLLERQTKTMQKLVDGWFRALDFLQKNPQDASIRIAPRQRVTPEQFLKSLEGLRFPQLEDNKKLLGKADDSSLKNIKKLAKFLVVNKLLNKAIDPTELFDDRLIKNVTLQR